MISKKKILDAIWKTACRWSEIAAAEDVEGEWIKHRYSISALFIGAQIGPSGPVTEEDYTNGRRVSLADWCDAHYRGAYVKREAAANLADYCFLLHEVIRRERYVTHKVHYLRIWRKYFELLLSREKEFELRRDNRGYKEGDRVVFYEFQPETDEDTGRKAYAKIGYVLRDAEGLADGYCMFQVKDFREAK